MSLVPRRLSACWLKDRPNTSGTSQWLTLIQAQYPGLAHWEYHLFHWQRRPIRIHGLTIPAPLDSSHILHPNPQDPILQHQCSHFRSFLQGWNFNPDNLRMRLCMWFFSNLSFAATGDSSPLGLHGSFLVLYVAHGLKTQIPGYVLLLHHTVQQYEDQAASLAWSIVSSHLDHWCSGYY